MNQNSRLLQELVRAYHNDGIECFKEYQYKLQHQGIVLHFVKPQFNLFGGVGSWVELLEANKLIINFAEGVTYRRLSRPFFYLSSEYSLVVLDEEGQEISQTINFCLKEKEVPNIPVTKEFLDKFLKTNSLSLKIKLIKKGDSQIEDESKPQRFLSEQQFAEYYNQEIFKIVSTPHKFNTELILERLQIFGIILNSIDELNKMVKEGTVSPSTFGITDTRILYNIFKKFKIPTLRNEDLLKLDTEQEETSLEILKFLHHLRENEIPEFSFKKTR